MNTHIESTTDSRMAILLQTLVMMSETLALQLDCNSEQILSENLFIAAMKVMVCGEEGISNKALLAYPIIQELLD